MLGGKMLYFLVVQSPFFVVKPLHFFKHYLQRFSPQFYTISWSQ